MFFFLFLNFCQKMSISLLHFCREKIRWSLTLSLIYLKMMNLTKLFGSKTRADIIKYLIFRRQGVSMRTLEAEIWWTFPVIKKQIESLEDAGILQVKKGKEGSAWAIFLEEEEFWSALKEVFYIGLKSELKAVFAKREGKIITWYWGELFGKAIGTDIVMLYEHLDQKELEQVKDELNWIFAGYWIENVSVVFMSKHEWDSRHRLADKFVLRVLTQYK